MNGLFLHTSNRLEILAEELAEVAKAPLPSPFTPEIVMVQSLGMHRWISLQLAERLGVCMHFQFPFPRGFLNETLPRLVPEMAPPDAFSVELMTWKIHRILPALLERPEFAPVRHYTADGDAIKRYQLASRLAGLFDQYLVYRPRMLLQWERAPEPREGELPLFERTGDEAWQALLWRELNKERLVHFGAALEKLAARGDTPPEPGAQRISIFGISSLPPSQMEVFFHLAASRPVHLFLLAPSSEYHGDDLTPKQRARRGLEAASGNPLLTSLGRLNAHFTEILLETDERAGHRIVDETEAFMEPAGESLLHRVQRDILFARDPAEPPESDPERPEIAPDDETLRIHVCHSPMREVEVLYDQLLAMFEADPALQPREVLVMTPDIEKYAPFIHAVFGYPEDTALRIPFSVADRHPRGESRAVDTFLRLLELPGSRCTAPELYALLQSGPFREKFGWDENELQTIRRWIETSGIRWGLDGEHRAEMGLPAFAEATWRHGLDRLLLGYAMPGRNRTLFEGVLPYDDVEGTGAELVGRLASAMEGLAATVSEWSRPRPLGEWPAVLETVIDRFFGAGEKAGETEAVRGLRELCGPYGQLATAALAANPARESEEALPFEVIREHLTGVLATHEQRGQFLTGGVTFCALKPMRSIPAKVIWLLGMDDGAFPRSAQPLQFDLMARQWKLGDRSARDDDRYIFLEALLSARDRLCISTLGRSQIDNEEIPPSIVVSELLDYLDRMGRFPDGGSARKALLVEHRLHAFSARYFDGGARLFSYSAANAAASRGGHGFRDRPFLGLALPEPEAEERTVRLDSLLEFFANPAAFFLKRRLGLRLEKPGGLLPESEPMEIDARTAYDIRKELFEPRLANSAAAEPGTFAARTLLPPGSIGAREFRSLDRAAESFYTRLVPHLGAREEPRSVDLPLGDFTLTGTFQKIHGGRLVFFRPAGLKPKDQFDAWISHLAWCACGGTTPTLLAGQDKAFLEFLPPENPRELLEILLGIYWRGLTEPVHFFPSSALQYMECRSLPNSRRAPLDAARQEWLGGFATRAESDHPAYQLCFRGTDPLDADFTTLAEAVAGPLLAARQPLPE